jgi:agmatine deiminase
MAQLIRALPEWVPNAACLTAWPAHEYAWEQHLEAAQREFAGFCAALLSDPRSEPIDLLVDSHEHERDARRALEQHGARVRYHRVPYGDVWLRDTSPIFARTETGELAAVRFAFNGWGGKYQYLGDDTLAARLIANLYKVPCEAYPLITEGGALELDGEGLCLTTESCLLNDNRDSSPEARATVEGILKAAFGASHVLWLGEGLEGDHTDGHIDNIARFVGPGAVVHMRASDAHDPNTAVLAKIEKDLGAMRTAAGKPLTLHAIPSPSRVLNSAGEVMAASYTNFYLGNAVVVMPSFGTPHDEPARAALAEIFPKHQVIACPARSFLEGGGTFHCMTRQVPRTPLTQEQP